MVVVVVVVVVVGAGGGGDDDGGSDNDIDGKEKKNHMVLPIQQSTAVGKDINDDTIGVFIKKKRKELTTFFMTTGAEERPTVTPCPPSLPPRPGHYC